MNSSTKQQHEMYYLATDDWDPLAGDWDSLEHTMRRAQDQSLRTDKAIRVHSYKSPLPIAIYMNGVCYEPRHL
jgi:hypothetical protein